MYCIDRYDVNRNVLELGSIDERLKYCKRNIVDIYAPFPFEFFIKSRILKKRIPVLHNYAPGDFIILSRDKWHFIRGYPEIDFLGTGSDNIVIYMAYLSGARQKVLKRPMRLYHIDHDSRWKNPSYLKFKKIFIRMRFPHPVAEALARLGGKIIPSQSEIAKVGVPVLGSEETVKVISDMVDGKRSYVYNDEYWGLGESQLDEFLVT